MINLNARRGSYEILGALLITVIIVIVAMYILFQWFGGFIPPEDNAKQTAMNMAEVINEELDIATGLFSCRDVDVAIYPDYQLWADSGELRVLHRGEAGEPEEVGDGYKYDAPLGSSKNVCSPYGKDPSVYNTHCPDELIFNLDWDNKVVGIYCICAMHSNGVAPAQVKGKIIVYPKRGLTCANLMGNVADWGVETASDKARSTSEKYYTKLKDTFGGKET